MVWPLASSTPIWFGLLDAYLVWPLGRQSGVASGLLDANLVWHQSGVAGVASSLLDANLVWPLNLMWPRVWHLGRQSGVASWTPIWCGLLDTNLVLIIILMTIIEYGINSVMWPLDRMHMHPCCV